MAKVRSMSMVPLQWNDRERGSGGRDGPIGEWTARSATARRADLERRASARDGMRCRGVRRDGHASPLMPRYVVVAEREVAPGVVADGARHRGAGGAGAGLGRHARDQVVRGRARAAAARQVAAAREVFVPGDGVAKAGNVPPFVRYSAERGLGAAFTGRHAQSVAVPARHATPRASATCGRSRQASTEPTNSRPEAMEDDADAWAASELTRLGF